MREILAKNLHHNYYDLENTPDVRYDFCEYVSVFHEQQQKLHRQNF